VVAPNGGLSMTRIGTLLVMVSLVVTGMVMPLMGQVGAKVYIEPQDGFESYISAAVIKKHVPIVVTMDTGIAEFSLTSSVISKEESTGGKIVRCLFAYCAGAEGTQTVTVRLINNTSGEVVWAYNVIKPGAHLYQSTAEAIAKHLKKFFEKGY